MSCLDVDDVLRYASEFAPPDVACRLFMTRRSFGSALSRLNEDGRKNGDFVDAMRNESVRWAMYRVELESFAVIFGHGTEFEDRIVPLIIREKRARKIPLTKGLVFTYLNFSKEGRLEEELSCAIHEGDLKTIRELIKKEEGWDALDDAMRKRRTMNRINWILPTAARLGREQMVKTFLAELPEDLPLQDPEVIIETTLRRGHTGIADLLSVKAPIDPVVMIKMAAARGDVPRVHGLMEKFDIKAPGGPRRGIDDWRSYLPYAIEGGNLELVKFFAGDDCGNDVTTCLSIAAQNKNEDMVCYLLDEIYDDPVVEWNQPMYWAAWSGSMNMLKLFILLSDRDKRRGIHASVADYGYILTGAVYNGSLEVVRFLVEEKNATPTYALDNAIRSFRPLIVEYLLGICKVTSYTEDLALRFPRYGVLALVEKKLGRPARPTAVGIEPM